MYRQFGAGSHLATGVLCLVGSSHLKHALLPCLPTDVLNLLQTYIRTPDFADASSLASAGRQLFEVSVSHDYHMTKHALRERQHTAKALTFVPSLAIPSLSPSPSPSPPPDYLHG